MARHNCADCIHKDVCALWEIQNGIGDAECVYYRPTLTLQNEPLTLGQLREMDGEPVWIDDEKTWALLQVWDGDNIDAVFPMPRGCFHAENVIGKKIFRRPSEGEEEAI